MGHLRVGLQSATVVCGSPLHIPVQNVMGRAVHEEAPGLREPSPASSVWHHGWPAWIALLPCALVVLRTTPPPPSVQAAVLYELQWA